MTIKCYLIVTNDEYEYPVTTLEGASAVAEFTGKKLQDVRRSISTGHWSRFSKYKAIVDEDATKEMLERRKEERMRKIFYTDYYTARRIREKERKANGIHQRAAT